MQKSKVNIKNNSGQVYQNTTINNYHLLDELIKKFQDGESTDAIEMINAFKKSLAGWHPLFPNYSVDIVNRNGQLVFKSIPNSDEAIHNYPIKYVGKMTIPEKYAQFSSITELLDYSYKNQTDIDINVLELKKMLGDQEDPFPDDVPSKEELKNSIWKIKHKEFPPAKPFKFLITTSGFSIDYLLLRAQRIDEDNRIILSNHEQDSMFEITIIADWQNEKSEMNFRINDKYRYDVEANLQFIKFLLEGESAGHISIISLEDNTTLMTGVIVPHPVSEEDKFQYKILENLKVIEQHYGTKISLNSGIRQDDADNIFYLANAIIEKEYNGSWSEASLQLEINKENKVFDWTSDDPMNVSIVHTNVEVLIFNNRFIIPKVIRAFLNAKLSNLSILKEKALLLSDGDIITVKFYPATEEKAPYREEFNFDNTD